MSGIKITRGRAWTVAEDQRIRLLLDEGKSVRAIGTALGRGKSGVHSRIKAMKATDAINQGVLNMGQFDEN